MRRGITVIYSIISLVVLCAFCSLGAEYARVQLVKMELERAADAAARAAASALPVSDASGARSAAISIASYHNADASPVVLDPSDIEVGAYASGVFTSNATPANAVRVTAGRTAARGNAVPLSFARVVGMASCDARATCIATCTLRPFAGLIGLNGISIKNNLYIGSYKSAMIVNPSSGSGNSNALIGSNGDITVGNNGTLQGEVDLGPPATISSGLAISGTTSHLSSPISAPAMPAWSPGTNPAGVPQAYAVSSDTILPGGTYWFTSLSINSTLSFSGVATLYVNGDIDVSGGLTAANSIPANLVIYQLGASRIFGNSGGNNMDVTAYIIAPGADFQAKNNLSFKGSGFFKSIDVKNNADFFYDESLGSAKNSVTVVQVK